MPCPRVAPHARASSVDARDARDESAGRARVVLVVGVVVVVVGGFDDA